MKLKVLGRNKVSDRNILALFFFTIWNFILRRLLGYCPYCEKFFDYSQKRRRLNTAYADEKLNYVVCCEAQYREIFDYYEERWRDYYSSCM